MRITFIYKLIWLWLLCITTSVAYAADDKSINYFLSLSDIHFDPFTNCKGKPKPCELIQKLRENSATQWPQILALYDRQLPQFKQNTNYVLLTSMFQAAAEAVDNKHAQFVLVLGDFLGHEYYSLYKRFSKDKTRAGYQAFVRKTLVFLTNQMKAAFPHTSVYAAVGNNDSYQGDYYMVRNGSFFNDTAALWSDLIIDPQQRISMREQFGYAGYYALTLTAPPQVRLIVLNSNYFSSKAKGSDIIEVALKQLNWLHTQLQNAKDKNQKVLIVMHMPEGFDVYATLHTRLFRLFTLWKTPYIKRFEAELKQFAPTIAGIFAGHLHRDWMQILTFDDHEISVIGITSISPIFGNNPGFKLCAYADNMLQPNDFIDYVYAIHGDNAWKQKYARLPTQDCSKSTCISELH